MATAREKWGFYSDEGSLIISAAEAGITLRSLGRRLPTRIVEAPSTYQTTLDGRTFMNVRSRSEVSE